MRVFVTGATGFVGSAVVQELLDHGHSVLGLTRSDAGAEKLAALGATAFHGDLEDVGKLQSGAASCDAVIHTAFDHDFSRYVENCEKDRRVIRAMGAVLAGSDRPMIVTSGIALLRADRPLVESDTVSGDIPRKASDEAAAEIAADGVNVSVMRLPPSVHGAGDHGFVPLLINLAREKGFAACIEDGENLWPAVHRFDAARAYRLAIEDNASQTAYHAVAEEGVAFADIAHAISVGLDVPFKSMTLEQAEDYFGWFSHFAAIDCCASSGRTQQALGWVPREIGLIEDMQNAGYFDE
ncbi:SDR family oxidoreductase [Thalassospira sp.]|uniref:SDR family oxidoreductase n=1 Tax=Thalassospira sp. TaxID=1912094 RepID=UPI000C658BC8|nr:SDR family oxidoreductase [Thalassospira sp.]MBC05356.1 3-beta hydroxysteroid dehydrogenase [Thalassospira sp.]